MAKTQTQRIDRLVKQIYKGTKDAESYGSGLAQEKIIVSAYKTMTIEQLEALRYIMNKIIKQKRIARSIKENESKIRDTEST